MRYAQIREMDVSNGRGIGVSLFVQGCDFHCKGCFNKETWNLNGGQQWTRSVEERFLQLIDRPYVDRVSILGGEPLHKNNLEEVTTLIKDIKEYFPEVEIWLYTGYTFEDLSIARFAAVMMVDFLVDGQFKIDLCDLRLPFKGSSNQRIIDIKKTLDNGSVVLYKGV